MPPTKFTEMRNSAELLQKVQTNPGLILIKFTADWCGPCKRIQPIVDKNLGDLPEDKVHYYEIDIDEHLDLYAFLKTKKMVNGIPALLAWKPENLTFIPTFVVIGGNESEVQKFFDHCKNSI